MNKAEAEKIITDRFFESNLSMAILDDRLRILEVVFSAPGIDGNDPYIEKSVDFISQGYYLDMEEVDNLKAGIVTPLNKFVRKVIQYYWERAPIEAIAWMTCSSENCIESVLKHEKIDSEQKARAYLDKHPIGNE